MDLEQLIKHPEIMDKETLYDLRSQLALHPYHQTARLLLLQNLYLMHDRTFDEELRRSAVYLTDRTVVFNLVEAAHYKLKNNIKTETKKEDGKETAKDKDSSRTISLIEQFLDTIPADKKKEETDKKDKKKRKPTPADAAIDYVSYLMEAEEDEEETTPQNSPTMKGQALIDNFINNDNGKIKLKEEPEFIPELDDNDKKDGEDSYFTETLAQIYIKQGRYSKALEIIKRLNLNYPKKNAYFADQIRFLEKLIINNKYK